MIEAILDIEELISRGFIQLVDLRLDEIAFTDFDLNLITLDRFGSVFFDSVPLLH